MNENEIALYLADRMKLMSDYSKGILQSPQAKQMAEYMIKSGGRLPQDFNYITNNPSIKQSSAQAIRSLAPKSFSKIASSLLTPAAGLITSGLLYSGGTIDEDRKRWDNMEQQLRNAGLKSQEDFDAIYPTLDTRTRGFAGRMFPEYYQNYINRL